MLRSKSPFKKKSPKEPQVEEVPLPASNGTNQTRGPSNPNQTPDDPRPSIEQWHSVQEFQEYQKERHLLQGNAFAQNLQKRVSRERESGGRSRSGTVS